MAETRVVHPHSARRRLRKHASTVIRVVPLGVVLRDDFLPGSVGPDDFARNYANKYNDSVVTSRALLRAMDAERKSSCVESYSG